MSLQRSAVGATLAIGIVTAWIGACSSSTSVPCGIDGLPNGTCQAGPTCQAGSTQVIIVDPFDMCPGSNAAGSAASICCAPSDAGSGSQPPDATTGSPDAASHTDATVKPDSSHGPDAAHEASVDATHVDVGHGDAGGTDTGTEAGVADTGPGDAGAGDAPPADASHSDVVQPDGGHDASLVCGDGTACTTAADCPPSATLCLTATCTAGCCGTANAAKGTACTGAGGAVVCDGNGACVATHCTDGILDAGETDVDCGGSCGPTCKDTGPQQKCLVGGDCVSGVCGGTPLLCQPPSCTDGVLNGAETGVDCGGATCDTHGKTCGIGTSCGVNGDCQSGECQAGVCGVLANGGACTGAAQCSSGNCVTGVCCDTACAGACQACGATGACGPVADGTTCTATATCTLSASCQGGACTGTACASGLCGTSLSAFSGALTTGWTFNGNAFYDGAANTVVLADGTSTGGQAGTLIYQDPITVDSVSISFDFLFTQTNGRADGLAFMIQTDGSTVVGSGYGGFGVMGLDGYGVELDIFDSGPCDPGNGNHAGVDYLSSCASGNPANGGIPLPIATSGDLYNGALPNNGVGDIADGSWRTATIQLVAGQVSVSVTDFLGNPVPVGNLQGVTLPGFVSGTPYYVGFGGGTGSNDEASREEIRNVSLTFGSTHCL